MKYPRWRFARDGRARQMASPEEELRLGGEWADSPAEFGEIPSLDGSAGWWKPAKPADPAEIANLAAPEPENAPAEVPAGKPLTGPQKSLSDNAAAKVARKKGKK